MTAMTTEHDEFTAARLGRMQKDIAELRARADNTDTRLAHIESLMAAQALWNTSAQAQLTDIGANLRQMDRRFDLVDARIERIEARLEGIEGHLTGIKEAVNIIAARLPQLGG